MLRGGIVLSLMALTGCNEVLPDLSGAEPITELALVGGAVTAAGPSDYCVDATTSQPRRGLALIAACSTLKGEGAIPWRNAVIAVQVGEAGSAAVAGFEAQMAAFLETPAGAALLSRSGQPDAIEVRDTTAGQRGVTVIFTDTGPLPIPGTQQAEWRGFMDINDRLVTVSLRGLADDPLREGDGASLLREAMSAMRAANAADG